MDKVIHVQFGFFFFFFHFDSMIHSFVPHTFFGNAAIDIETMSWKNISGLFYFTLDILYQE